MFQTILHIVLTWDLTAKKTNLQSVNNHIRLPRASLRRYLCNLDLKRNDCILCFFSEILRAISCKYPTRDGLAPKNLFTQNKSSEQDDIQPQI